MRHFYDIHGLVQVSSNKPVARLRRFEVNHLSDAPEIELKFGAFTPDLRGYKKVVKCWVEDRSLFLKDWYKICRFKIWIRGLDTEFTRIWFDGDPFFSREVFHVLILEPYLTKKLSRFGSLLLHAAGLSVDGRGYAISGLTGTGKTTLLLRLLNLSGARYFSDDQTIVKDGEMFCYPMPIGFRGHLLRSSGVSVGVLDGANIAFGDFVNWATDSYGNYTHRVEAEDMTLPNGSGVKVGDRAPLRGVFMLNTCGRSGVTEVNGDEAYALLMEHNKRNEDKQKLLFRFFTRYQSVYPEFSYWERYESLMRDFTKRDGIRWWRIDMADRYTVDGLVDEIKVIVKHE